MKFMKHVPNMVLITSLFYNLGFITKAAKNYNFYMENYKECLNEVGYENDSQGIKHLNCI